MGNYFKLVFRVLKVFILFTGCTILFYYAIMWISEEYLNHHKYDEPDGKAISVFSDGQADTPSWYERLILFYIDGE